MTRRLGEPVSGAKAALCGGIITSGRAGQKTELDSSPPLAVLTKVTQESLDSSGFQWHDTAALLDLLVQRG
jgi:hypothetical protein